MLRCCHAGNSDDKCLNPGIYDEGLLESGGLGRQPGSGGVLCTVTAVEYRTCD